MNKHRFSSIKKVHNITVLIPLLSPCQGYSTSHRTLTPLLGRYPQHNFSVYRKTKVMALNYIFSQQSSKWGKDKSKVPLLMAISTNRKLKAINSKLKAIGIASDHLDAAGLTKTMFILLKLQSNKHNQHFHRLIPTTRVCSSKATANFVTIGSVHSLLENGLFLKQNKRCLVTYVNKRDSSYYTDKDKVVSITYEEIGLFPRSFSRVLDRFLKQLFSDVDNLVIQEYRFYRYLFLTTIKTIFILFFVPFLVNFAAKNYVVKPITEYFWNTNHTEIFLNSYEQKRAFAELENFEEKIYFETLVESHSQHNKNENSLSKPSVSQINAWPKQEKVIDNSKLPPSPFGAIYPYSLQKYSKGSPNDNIIPNALHVNTTSSLPMQVSLYNTPALEIFDFKPQTVLKQQMDTQCFLENKRRLLEQFFMRKNNLDQNPVREYSTTLEGLDKNNNLPEETSSQLALTTNESLPLLQKPKTQQPPVDYFSQQKAKVFSNSITQTSYNFIRYQEKTIELATYYNNHSIEAITNFFADLLSLCTLLYLLITLSIQINITKSFLLEVFFGLDDSKKSLLILLVTDLLVGYHSSNLWELFFEFIFNHYGIPESQTGIFLLVATLPVLLDVLFKYLIFRHLNRSSPATVATYQAIIE